MTIIYKKKKKSELKKRIYICIYEDKACQNSHFLAWEKIAKSVYFCGQHLQQAPPSCSCQVISWCRLEVGIKLQPRENVKSAIIVVELRAVTEIINNLQQIEWMHDNFIISDYH